MIRIDLPFDAPPITKNKVRRMHYQAEAKLRRDVIEQVRWSIKAARIKPVVGANVVLHWRVRNKRRQDGDGADPFKAACIDALVLEGVLPDDSWVCVPHSGVTCHPPSDDGPATWLEIDVLTYFEKDTPSMSVLEPDAPVNCRGKFNLFESTFPPDHKEAAALCGTCPSRLECYDNRPGPLDGFEGTWAGIGYNIHKPRAAATDAA